MGGGIICPPPPDGVILRPPSSARVKRRKLAISRTVGRREPCEAAFESSPQDAPESPK